MTALGVILIIAGIALLFIHPRLERPRTGLTGLRIRGTAGPILIVIGILVLTGVIS